MCVAETGDKPPSTLEGQSLCRSRFEKGSERLEGARAKYERPTVFDQ
jgi:hypothetical protein